MESKFQYLLTGASKGIGKSVLDLLVKKKLPVIVLVRKSKDLLKYKNNKNIKIFNCDVTNKKNLVEVFAYIKKEKIKIKYLINNAGQRQRKKFVSISNEEIKHIFNINYFSLFNLTQMFVKYAEKKNIKLQLLIYLQ